jgi:hypothetical protein
VPSSGGETIIVNAIDPDGDGPQDIEIDGPINLIVGTTYTLTMQFINGLYSSGQDGYDVTAEVLKEGDEHQVFFAWGAGSFNDPVGTGNINSTGSVNYLDEDDNSRPIGISTMLGLNEKLLQIFKFQDTFVISLSKDNRKNAHVV